MSEEATSGYMIVSYAANEQRNESPLVDIHLEEALYQNDVDEPSYSYPPRPPCRKPPPTPLRRLIRLSVMLSVLLMVLTAGVVIILASTMLHKNHELLPVHRCILLIGGSKRVADPLIEYFHPTKGECGLNGRMSQRRVIWTKHTSACYLSHSQQILIRDGRYPRKPPMIYGLFDASANTLPLPYKDSTWRSTTASISPSACLSCGGESVSANALQECYQFSSATNWTSIAPLPRRLTDSASVSVGNDYYIIGGREDDPRRGSKQMYRYSVNERRWYEETPMSRARFWHSATALSTTEFLVCGGYFIRNDCEMYNATAKVWRAVGNLTMGRQYFAMVTFEGSFLAIGGSQSGFVDLDSVEEYNVLSEKWTVVKKKLKYARSAFVSVVV